MDLGKNQPQRRYLDTIENGNILQWVNQCLFIVQWMCQSFDTWYIELERKQFLWRNFYFTLYDSKGHNWCRQAADKVKTKVKYKMVNVSWFLENLKILILEGVLTSCSCVPNQTESDKC